MSFDIDEDAYEDFLQHYGILRKSGRYPWGSGQNQNTRNRDFLDYVANMRRQGLTEKQIADGVGLTTTQLRATKSIALAQQRNARIIQAQRLKATGMSNGAIATEMGLPNESSVRSLLTASQDTRTDILQTTAAMLRDQVAEKKYVDVGSGVAETIGLTENKLSTSIAILQDEGYQVHTGLKVRQLGTGEDTRLKILTKEDVTFGELARNRSQIRQIRETTDDGGLTYSSLQPPISIDSKRIGIVYKEQGGGDSDGVIYVRRGVEDVSLGSSRYAQVRVLVDNSHYLKGMAIYSDDMPKGVDLLFHTVKSDTGNKHDAMKSIKDEENPFGAIVKQIQKKDANGNDIPNTVSSAMNTVNIEGDWAKWSRSLSSQMLSKQSLALAKSQLDMTYERRQNQLDEILAMTNPTVRKKLLETYADATDSAAVHLKAAALPRQANRVILPMTTLKDNEVYAPGFREGESVVLVRYPHGGPFEIPELRVNNKNAQGRSLLGNATSDAIGISPATAARLSGADFDGDAVLVIPNGRGHVKTAPALKGLKDFDPMIYKIPKDSPIPRLTEDKKQTEMGKITNLIADMSVKGASGAEMAAAVRHSMVVIDAAKKELDYKASFEANGIANLKRKYQEGADKGASTLITRAGSEKRIPEIKPRPAKLGGPVDRDTGQRVFVATGRQVMNRKGELVDATTKTEKLAITRNAHDLITGVGTPIERVYADHSNRLKALADRARLEAIRTQTIPYSPSAKATYSEQVARLDAALSLAIRNRPLERQAQIVANSVVSAKRQANPNMDSDTRKKVEAQALQEARLRTGAKKTRIVISQDEWDAIQAGAISNSKLSQILDNADLETVKKLATPKSALLMSPSKHARAIAMMANGYDQQDIADQLGVSLSTLKADLNG